VVACVLVSDSSGNLFQGNYFGTERTGLSWQEEGVGLIATGSNNNTIGGTLTVSRNILTTVAFSLTSRVSEDNLIQGNYIGLGADGSTSLGFAGTLHSGDGVRVTSSERVVIGGSVPGAGNVISGQTGSGVSVSNGSGHLILGNLIGTDASGLKAVGNEKAGVRLAADQSRIGEDGGGGNVIVSSGDDGVFVNGDGNTVAANSIGIAEDGRTPIGNAGAGIDVYGNGNRVGGEGADLGNVIAYSGAAGISLTTFINENNRFLGNSIFSNEGLGIDLIQYEDRKTTPSITGVMETIQGSVTGAPDTEVLLQFFSNTACDPTGFGEGETYLGSITVATDATGNVGFSAPFAPLSGQPFITATATPVGGNTSEFSNCIERPQDSVEILSISPDAAGGFPTLTSGGSIAFSSISVGYELTSDNSGTLFVRVFADNNIDSVLGEVSQPVTSAGSLVQFNSLVA
ncbi:MAG: hypothetical protein JSU96_16430, partial [Acidobacteriota bacterium]